MENSTDFEGLLNSDFRWPRKGDKPFVSSEDGFKNACVASDKLTRFVLMMEGYKKAADLMVIQATKNSSDRDFLVFPIIFNYRQFLELSLKYLLDSYGHYEGIKANWKSHDLAFLWSEFGAMLQAFNVSDPDNTDPVVKKIIAEFSKIDPDSYSYRYPVDTKGNPIPLSHDVLDLEQLADVIEGVAGYFTGCDGYLDSLVSAVPDFY